MYRIIPRPWLSYVTLTLLSILICRSADAQENIRRIDSLKSVLSRSGNDSSRAELCIALSYLYLWTDADSSLHFAEDAYAYSKKSGSLPLEVKSLIRLTTSNKVLNRDSASLRYAFQANALAHNIGDGDLILRCNSNIAALYADLGRNEEALPYLRLAIDQGQKMGDSIVLAHSLVNMAMTHLELGHPDSALDFANRAYSLGLHLNWDVDFIGTALRTMGRIQQMLGNADIAMAYYRRSLPSALAFRDWSDMRQSTQYMGELFEENRKIDSALFYYHQALYYANLLGATQDRLSAANSLAKLYRLSNKDSALKYLDMTLVLKDSLSSEGRTRMINNLMYAENQREEARKAAMQESEDKRVRNIRLLGITVFIITLFLLLMLLARMKANPKLVRFSGIISLLLLFEFVTLLVHPLVAGWTHENPVWMLLALVILAAIIAPLHHRIESWMMHKLAGQPISPSRAS